MTLPLTTTTVTVRRELQTGDEDEVNPPALVIGTVGAQITPTSGRGEFIGGVQQTVDARGHFNPIDVRAGDTVKDNVSGLVYRVLYIQKRYELGLNHVVAGLLRSEGAA